MQFAENEASELVGGISPGRIRVALWRLLQEHHRSNAITNCCHAVLVNRGSRVRKTKKSGSDVFMFWTPWNIPESP